MAKELAADDGETFEQAASAEHVLDDFVAVAAPLDSQLLDVADRVSILRTHRAIQQLLRGQTWTAKPKRLRTASATV